MEVAVADAPVIESFRDPYARPIRASVSQALQAGNFIEQQTAHFGFPKGQRDALVGFYRTNRACQFRIVQGVLKLLDPLLARFQILVGHWHVPHSLLRLARRRGL